MKYAVKGYTGPDPDFTDIIEIADSTNFTDCLSGDARFTVYARAIKPALLDSNCETEYLNVFDECGGECRDDLAQYPGQVVLIAESMGCEACQVNTGCNERTDGCDSDAPHGGYMLTFDPIN